MVAILFQFALYDATFLAKMLSTLRSGTMDHLAFPSLTLYST